MELEESMRQKGPAVCSHIMEMRPGGDRYFF